MHLHHNIAQPPSYLCIYANLNSVNSVTTSIEMISDGNEAFRVRCTSTGGRVLNMSVTGPDFNFELSNIQAVGNQTWMGNDSYTATTGNITGSSEKHEVYYCTASNGVSSLTDCLVIKGDLHVCFYLALIKKLP